MQHVPSNSVETVFPSPLPTPNEIWVEGLSRMTNQILSAKQAMFAEFCHMKMWVNMGGTVASWLVHLTPEQAVWVRVLGRDVVLCSWARHSTLTVALSTGAGEFNPGGNTAMD